MKVTWDESTCIHAGKCVEGSPNVFKVVDGAFVIDESGAPEDEIRATAAQCPSGAIKIED
ncbi:MAG: (4Fe-4S)-binding protein [Gammaproteobacteria bacterium]|nr:(4Fe-4S)-binding protein [Gammaproteobacteria bacterium]